MEVVVGALWELRRKEREGHDSSKEACGGSRMGTSNHNR